MWQIGVILGLHLQVWSWRVEWSWRADWSRRVGSVCRRIGGVCRNTRSVKESLLCDIGSIWSLCVVQETGAWGVNSFAQQIHESVISGIENIILSTLAGNVGVEVSGIQEIQEILIREDRTQVRERVRVHVLNQERKEGRRREGRRSLSPRQETTETP